uniref:Membrane associated ring-CH-type finger 5 n=1 Tax=Gallus gallus TaxID=9031 RepID=A0A8V0ZIG5_CHICK
MSEQTGLALPQTMDRSSCLRFGSCRSTDLKGMSICCSWNNGGLHILDSSYIWSCDSDAGTCVVGHKEGLDVMERADPLFLLIGLPTIPVMLILGKMIRWEDYVLRLWRKYSNKLQILNSIFPGIGCPVPRIPAEANPLADHVSATRILCGALVFPTIATIVGKLMFSSVNSNLQRTILGGIAFVAIKGAFKVYFKQQQYLRQAHRKILNYPEQEGA